MKILVAHSGTQHSMRLAISLKKLGHDVKYVTTVYNKKKSFTRFVSKFLKGDISSRAEARRTVGLSETEVCQVCELYGLMMLLVKRLDKKKKLYNHMEHRMRIKFGKKVVKLATGYDIVFMFDTQASYAFQKLNELKCECIKVIDYSAAYAEDSLCLYKNVMAKFPQYAKELFDERKMLWDTKKMTFFQKELLESDYVLMASNFVKESVLKYQPNKKCFVVPYGASFQIEKEDRVPTETLKILYVGNVTVMKGIPFIFEALANLKDANLEVVFVGAVADNIKNMAGNDPRCHFVGRVPHDTVKNYLKDVDVFLFPSLSDGFGIAPLEAMYYGIPCIISKNAGASDIIAEGKNGFIIPAMSAKAIQDKLEWCLHHRQELVGMREIAYQTAEKYTWDYYTQGIQEMLNEICME